MANNIVTVNVNQIQAPAPSTLQQSGAFISQGGTTLTAGTTSLLTQFSDLTPLLRVGAAITSLAWASGVVTVTTTSAHGLPNTKVLKVTIAGAIPTGYNGTYTATVSGTTTFTYPLAANPGTATTMGTWVSGSASELTQMATTFFSQGSSVSVAVLELGYGSVQDGVTALTTFLNNNNNPQIFYSYLMPRNWDGVAEFLALAATYQSTTAMTYFYVTTTNGTYTTYTALQKPIFAMIEAPSIPVTEFSAASAFWQSLHNNPSSVNKVAPMAFRYVFGVTPYPIAGSSTLFTAWKAAGVNWIATGSEGGISTAEIYWGRFMDGRPWNYWYSVDWMQINVHRDIANEIMNGSNNPINPLYADQDGINRIQARGYSVLARSISYGLSLGSPIQTGLTAVDFQEALENNVYAGKAVINAIPFASYYSLNPSDYRTGTYNGLSVTYTPLRGFESITVNINVTDFAA